MCCTVWLELYIHINSSFILRGSIAYVCIYWCIRPKLTDLVLTWWYSLETDSRLHVRITDADHPRWEVPQDIIPRPTSVSEDVLLGSPGMDNATLPSSATISKVSSDLTFSIHTNPFRFTVSRRSTGDILFDTSATLIFKDRYVINNTPSFSQNRSSHTF